MAQRSVWAVVVALLALGLPTCGYAGVTGKIAGSIRDTKTGEALVGANVAVVGTQQGAATDLNGEYFILNVPTGTYTIEVSLVGYQSYRETNVKVLPDFTRTLNAKLDATTLEGEVVTVLAERPLIEKDATGSTQVTTAKEIRNLPVRGFAGVTALQAGVVTGNGRQGGSAIQIRGGRAGEVSYLVDGFSTQDLVTGTSQANIPTTALSEVVLTSGGQTAEYGQAMSGVINVVTKDAGDKVSGSIELRTDAFLGNSGFNIANGEATIGIPTTSNGGAFLSGSWGYTGDYDPHFGADLDTVATRRTPHQQQHNWSAQAKIHQGIGSDTRLRLGGYATFRNRQIYDSESQRQTDDSWRYNLNHMPRREDLNFNGYLELNHSFSPSSFLNVRGNYFFTKTQSGDDSLFDDWGAYRNDVVWNTANSTGPDGRPDSTIQGTPRRTDGDNIYYLPGVSWRVFDKRQSSYIGASTDFTSQVNSEHQIKLGGEFKLYDVRRFRIDLPWRANPFIENYWSDTTVHNELIPGKPAKPTLFAGYVQDKMEFEGLVVNAGVRIDGFSSAESSFIDPLHISSVESLYNANRQATTADIKISPRLGLSFPATETSLLRFNYGQYFQAPDLQYLYEGVGNARTYIQTGNARIGNPGLLAEKTTQYEISWTQALNPTVRFDVTAFAKDIQNLVDVRLVPSIPFSYSAYNNSDYGTVRGLELALEMRREKIVSGKIAYTLQYANGSGSYQQESYYDLITTSIGSEINYPAREFPLDFDQRHTLNADLDFRFDKDYFTSGFGETGLNLLFTAGSGLPYTPRRAVNAITQGVGKATGPHNSARYPWSFNCDMKLDKTIGIGSTDVRLYVEVHNLFNTRNVSHVYEATGRADIDGFAFPSGTSQRFIDRYSDVTNTPLNYDAPRQLILGLTYEF